MVTFVIGPSGVGKTQTGWGWGIVAVDTNSTNWLYPSTPGPHSGTTAMTLTVGTNRGPSLRSSGESQAEALAHGALGAASCPVDRRFVSRNLDRLRSSDNARYPHPY